MDVEQNISLPMEIDLMASEPENLLLWILSITAMVTTISLFFCGIPICIEIWRRKTTHEISGFPFIMGFLGGTFWLRYGMLKLDSTMITVNCVGVSLMFMYMLFYLHYTKPKGSYLFQMTIVCAVISGMLILVEIYQFASLDPLGFVCMTFNIINFGAPLAGIRVVLRKRSVETLPLPLCVANLLVSSQWCLYGILVKDIYIIIPNGAGSALALLQVSLFLIFPRNVGGQSPIEYCCNCCSCCRNTTSGKIENQYQPVNTRALSLSARSRVTNERNIAPIPSSRTACIEFMRSDEFTSGRYRHFDNSISSRTTAASVAETITSASNGVGNNELNRHSSLSHPELYDDKIPVEDGDRSLPFDVSYQSTSNPIQPFTFSARLAQISEDVSENVEPEKRVRQENEMIRTSSAPDLTSQQNVDIGGLRPPSQNLTNL